MLSTFLAHIVFFPVPKGLRYPAQPEARWGGGEGRVFVFCALQRVKQISIPEIQDKVCIGTKV